MRTFVLIGATLSTLFGGGCGRNAAKQPTDKALEVVETFLEAWNRGDPADKFADAAQPVQGSDPDWKAGCRLMSFLTAEVKQSQETPNLFRCRVALSLRHPRGQMVEKEVVYEVQMGEKNVVRRASP
jgi:hypothetical protein